MTGWLLVLVLPRQTPPSTNPAQGKARKTATATNAAMLPVACRHADPPATDEAQPINASNRHATRGGRSLLRLHPAYLSVVGASWGGEDCVVEMVVPSVPFARLAFFRFGRAASSEQQRKRARRAEFSDKGERAACAVVC